MPLVSVLIAAYGMPDYLNEAVASVAGQSFGDYEIIVVDDCSGDDVVSQYRLPDGSRLICHSERFGAAAATRNTGIKAATGKYVAFLDQDDLWLPNKLERQMEALEHQGRDRLVFCHTLAVDSELRPIASQGRVRRAVRNPLKKMIGGCFIPTPSAVLAPLKAVRDCGMFDESIKGASDWDFYLRIARQSAFVAVPERLVLYRMHPDQLHKKIQFMNVAKTRVMDITLQWALDERPDLVRWVRSRYARVLYKIACQQMLGERPDLALTTLRQSRQMWFWSLRQHILALKAARALRREKQGEQ